MAILIEAISVVVRADAIIDKFPGGGDSFKSIVPNKTLCADDELARVGFMTPGDMEAFIDKLERFGLVHIRDGQAVDMNVVDQLRGITTACSWLEFGYISLQHEGKQEVSACRLADGKCDELVTPLDWTYESSLSQSYGFAPSEHLDKSLKYLRHDNGLDVYLNLVTGKEAYVGRTGQT